MKDHPHSETIAQGYLDIIQDIKNEKLNIKMFPSKSKVFEDIYKKVNVSIIFLNSKVKGMGRKKVGDLWTRSIKANRRTKSKVNARVSYCYAELPEGYLFPYILPVLEVESKLFDTTGRRVSG